MRFHRSLALLGIGLLALLRPAAAAPVDILPPELRGAVQPQVAVAPDGRVHVVFGKDLAIYHTSAADGRSFSPPVQVGELPKLALKMRRGPRIAAMTGVVLVTAISHADGNVHGWLSKDGGATWAPTAHLNSAANSAREGLHAVAGDGRGLVFAVWLDDRNGGKELWGAASRDGGATWEADHLVARSSDGHICECCHPSVAVLPGRNGPAQVAVMWRNWEGGKRDLYLTESRDGGAHFNTTAKLGPGSWPLQGCPMDGGAVVYDSAGRAQTIWRRQSDIFLCSGASTSEEKRLSTNGRQPVLATSPSGLVMVWESNGGLMLQREKGAPVRLADKAAWASMAARPRGGPVVAWESSATNPPTILVDLLP
jgi:hypothetical protein